MSRLRNRRPAPALVLATLALFVALGGTVWAATQIDGHSVKLKSLPGNRVIVGSLPGNRLRPGAISGNRVDSATLGRVPSAAHAEAAETARTAETAIHAQGAADSATVNGYAAGCEAGTRIFAGACWETRTQTVAMDAPQAGATCAHEGGELPRALALRAFGEQAGVTLEPEGEWSGEVGAITSPNAYSVLTISSEGTVGFANHTESRRFRCVLPLLH
jgi:hypothetical protein